MTNTQKTIDCDFDPASLQADQALDLISRQIKPIRQTEIVALRDALDRIVARDIKSPANIPNHTNSAMDGYAFVGQDIAGDSLHTFKVVGTSMAGSPCSETVNSGQCVRIMTGAVMPQGTDTVIMQEQVEVNADSITIAPGHKIGANVRRAGEDLAQGEVAIQKGTRMTPSTLGVVASLGLSEIPVFRKPRVAFFSNGDELRSIGETLKTGELYDSNRYSLHGLLSHCHVELIDMGIIGDNRDGIERALSDAAAIADMVITSAGASVGEADYIKPLLDQLGEAFFWKVAIKPGRPLAFGRIGESLFFGLPGNPVSVMVTFDLFVKPAINKLSGKSPTQPIRLTVPCRSRLRKRPGRSEFQRGILRLDPQGQYSVQSTGAQGSGMLTSMTIANCYIILPSDSEGIEAGENVLVQPFATTINA